MNTNSQFKQSPSVVKGIIGVIGLHSFGPYLASAQHGQLAPSAADPVCDASIIGLWGVDIPATGGPWGLFAVVAIFFVGWFLWDKMMTEKNIPLAILVGAVLIVITLVVLHGCH